MLRGHRGDQGSNPFGPYNVYFLNANYNPKEPGYPNLLNDFAKIGVTRDAFLLFYDEFPLLGGGLGGGGFNGAQEFAFDKTALEKGQSRHRSQTGDQTPTSTWPSRTWACCPRRTAPVLRNGTTSRASLLVGGDPGAASGLRVSWTTITAGPGSWSPSTRLLRASG